jgi:hypothetical protein
MTIAAETEAHHAAAPRRALEKRQATARGRWLTLLETEGQGLLIDGKTLTYWLIFAVVLMLFLVLLRIVNSLFGRVLQANALYGGMALLVISGASALATLTRLCCGT